MLNLILLFNTVPTYLFSLDSVRTGSRVRVGSRYSTGTRIRIRYSGAPRYNGIYIGGYRNYGYYEDEYYTNGRLIKVIRTEYLFFAASGLVDL